MQNAKGSGRLATALHVLDRLEEILIAFLIAMSTIIIFLAVVQRYGLSSTASLVQWSKAQGLDWLAAAARWLFSVLKSFRFTWAQELAIFMMVWMAKFGAAYGVRTGIHVGVDLLVNNLEGERKHWLILIGLFGGVLFTALIGVLGLRLVLHIAATGQTSAVLDSNLSVIDMAIDESRAALNDQPANDAARESLFQALRSKVVLLQDTVALINEMRKGDQDGVARVISGLNQ